MKIPPAGSMATQRANRGETTAAGVEKLATAGGETTEPGAGALPVDSFEKSAPSPFGALLGGRSIWSGDFVPSLQALPDAADTSPTNAPSAATEHERATIPTPMTLAELHEMHDALLEDVHRSLGEIALMPPGGDSATAFADLIHTIDDGFGRLIQSARATFDKLISQASTAFERDQLSKEAASFLDSLESQRDAMLAEVVKVSEQHRESSAKQKA